MARRGDVEARLRFGVRSLGNIGGLVPAVLAASGAQPRSLGSRRGWDEAFAAIRARHPHATGLPPALAHRGVPSRSLMLVHAAFTRLVDRFPGLPDSQGLARHAEGLALARVAAPAGLRARLGVTLPG